MQNYYLFQLRVSLILYYSSECACIKSQLSVRPQTNQNIFTLYRIEFYECKQINSLAYRLTLTGSICIFRLWMSFYSDRYCSVCIMAANQFASHQVTAMKFCWNEREIEPFVFGL